MAHPGSHLGAGIAEGVRRFAHELDRCLDVHGAPGPVVALETTAGQGSNLGDRFEHLRDIMAISRHSDRLGLCVDSCHIHAAGYEVVTDEGYDETRGALERVVGLDRVVAWHLNDSLKPRASRRDRHAKIGRGEIGLEALRRIVNDERWRGVAGCLETPGGPENWRQELRLLRGEIELEDMEADQSSVDSD